MSSSIPHDKNNIFHGVKPSTTYKALPLHHHITPHPQFLLLYMGYVIYHPSEIIY